MPLLEKDEDEDTMSDRDACKDDHDFQWDQERHHHIPYHAKCKLCKITYGEFSEDTRERLENTDA